MVITQAYKHLPGPWSNSTARHVAGKADCKIKAHQVKKVKWNTAALSKATDGGYLSLYSTAWQMTTHARVSCSQASKEWQDPTLKGRHAEFKGFFAVTALIDQVNKDERKRNLNTTTICVMESCKPPNWIRNCPKQQMWWVMPLNAVFSATLKRLDWVWNHCLRCQPRMPKNVPNRKNYQYWAEICQTNTCTS